MITRLFLAFLLLLPGAAALSAQEKSALSWITKSFVAIDAPVIALQHVRVIDGTGGPAAENQTVLIDQGSIREIGPDASVKIPEGAKIVDLSGRSVIPGLVGMHEHMYYPAPSGSGPVPGAPALLNEMGFSFPRLYLAGGVTAIRTAGSIEPYTDLALKKLIDSGEQPGPKMQFEHAFVKAGGVLLSGEDPTGYGGVVAGYGDQRQVELLVEAGFTPLEAIHIATQNGADFLGESDRIGTLKSGRRADIVVLKGDPSRKIEDIEKVELVFKDGIAYDPKKLADTVAGAVGFH